MSIDRRRARRGLTLAELMIASSILVLIVGVMGSLASAVRATYSYSYGHSIAGQHARVAFERIERAIRGAYSTPDHPGIGIVTKSVLGEDYPDTLVVWTPAGTPVNPDGPPLVNECVMFCADPNAANVLLEVTAPTDTRTIPLGPGFDLQSWQSEIDAIKVALTSKRVVLSDLLRVADTGSSDRAVLRFRRLVRPSVSEWSDYQSAMVAWEDLAWPEDLYSRNTGMRRVTVQLEVHFMPGYELDSESDGMHRSIPMMGSADHTYTLPK